MAYSTNPNLVKARKEALLAVVSEQMPVCIAARHFGVHRTTIWRWLQRWRKLNANVQLDNINRPSRTPGDVFRWHNVVWVVPTLSSAPKSHPRRIAQEIVTRILELRASLRRCAEVVWHHATVQEGLRVSLSSVRRILRSHHCFDGARKKRVRADNPRRPIPSAPGELVQIDTIHHVDPYSGRKLYYYTVIDLYSRAAYAIMSTTLSQGLAVRAVLEAQSAWDISIAMVQADNGPEFGRYFERQLTQRRHSISVRHSRLGRPNDNAHIERFNRTLQEECIGHYWKTSITLQQQKAKLAEYIRFYNELRVHLGIQYRVPYSMLRRS